jgi:dihydrofolate reductase
MKIIMVAAISKDGFLTKGKNPDVSEWTSDADKAFFKEIKSKHKLFVIGRKTFDPGAIKAVSGTLKIILTSNPAKFRKHSQNGQIEFMNLSAVEFVQKYQNSYKTCLLLGGSQVYTEFLRANLVDEIYLTVEPTIHSSGTPLLAEGKKLVDIIDLPSPELTDMNNSGTKLLHYVLK